MALADLRSQATRRTVEEMLEHLESFELEVKFSAGVWDFSPAFSRFHARYQPEIDVEQRKIGLLLVDDLERFDVVIREHDQSPA